MVFKNIKRKAKRVPSGPVHFITFVCMVLCAAVLSTSSLAGAVGVNFYQVHDGEKTVDLYALTDKPCDILAMASVTLGKDDKILKDGNQITVERAFPVTLIKGDNMDVVFTTTTTVEELLIKAGIEINETLSCEKDLKAVLNTATEIGITVTEVKQEVKTETIPFTYKEVKTNTLPYGTIKIKTAGSEGSKTITYSVTYVNGVETKREVISSVVTKAAENGVKYVGTKKTAKATAAKTTAKSTTAKAATKAVTAGKAAKTSNDVNCISVLKPSTPIVLDANGVPVNAKSSKIVQATAYHEEHGATATGVRAKPGIVAVNPKIIPYGTKMYIVSTDGKFVYGYCVAADTGGFIKSRPTNVDLNMATEAACNAFGRRNVIIYFL